jgi:hypothetical protein
LASWLHLRLESGNHETGNQETRQGTARHSSSKSSSSLQYAHCMRATGRPGTPKSARTDIFPASTNEAAAAAAAATAATAVPTILACAAATASWLLLKTIRPCDRSHTMQHNCNGTGSRQTAG